MQVFISLIDDDEKIMNDNFINVQIEYDKRKMMGKSFRDYMKWSINKETTEAGIYFDIYARLLNDKLNNISPNSIPSDAYNAYMDYVLSLKNIADLYIHHPHMPEQNKVDLKYDLINPFSFRKVWVTYKYLKFLDKDKEAAIRLMNNRLKIINIARKYGIHVKKEAYTGLFKEY